MMDELLAKAKARAAKAAGKLSQPLKSDPPKGPDTAIATPCRTRRKLSFRGASKETLKPAASTESLDSTDKKAIKERLRTVDKVTPTPSPRSSTSKAVDGKDDKVDKPASKDELAESGEKGNEAQEPEKSKVSGKTPAQRTKAFLELQKKKQLEAKSSNQDVNGKSTKMKVKEEASKTKKRKHVEGKEEVEVPKKKPEKTTKKPEKGKTDQEVQPAQDGEEEIATEEEQKKAHAMYMKYWRSLQSRSTPKEVKSLHKRFKYCKEQQSMLYEDFWACGGDWKRSTIYKSITNTLENKKTGKRKWLTRKQMLPIFDNDEKIVDGVILRKNSDQELRKTEVRKHPENPEVRQFLVLVEDEEEATETDKILDKFSMSTRSKDDSGTDVESDQDQDGSAESDDDDPDTPPKASKGKTEKKDKSKKEKQSSKDKKKADKGKKKKNRKGKSKENKDKSPEEKAAEKAKEDRKNLIKDIKKVINDVNVRIREANEKKKSFESWSPNVRDAMEKEVASLTAGLVGHRTQLQESLDSGLQDSKLKIRLQKAKDGMAEIDRKMEPITGKKRKAEKSESSKK